MRRPLIAVAGDGRLDRDDPRRALAHEVGRALVDARFRVLCGGLGGVMAAAAEGARTSPSWAEGDVIGLLPGLDPSEADPAVDIAIATGLGHLRNALIARADALVAIGGGAGTLSEVAMAWISDRPIVALRVRGWSGELAGRRIDARARFPHRPDDRVEGADTAADVVAHLSRLLG